jgi:hypothetical protein
MEPIATEIPLAIGILLAEIVYEWSFNTYGIYGLF